MRSVAERNELVEKNTGLVVFCVKKINFGEYDDDLFQLGCLGLIRAAELYDETLGFKFSTYAAKCIKGMLRREIYEKRRKIQENEISGDTPIGDGNVTIFDTIEDEDSYFADDLIDKITLEQIVSAFPPREKQVIELIKNDKTQAEIAEILNISQESVSKTFNKIIKMLQDRIELNGQKDRYETMRKERNNYMREWKSKNKERIRAKQRERYQKNREKVKEYQREYYEKNRETIREKRNNYMREWRKRKKAAKP